MPLRKQGTILKSAVVLGVAATFVVPSTANAGLLSSLFTPKKTTTTATTPAVTTPAISATGNGVATTNTSTTTATSSTTSSAVPSGTGCAPLATTKAFQAIDGDDSDYSLAPNGGFENGTIGWTLSGGAKVAAVNETLGISAGKKGLVLPLGASATSPAFCVDESNPHFRFAYKVDNAALSGFIAYVIYRDAAGQITNIELVSSKVLALSPSLWQASPKSPLSTLIPLNSSTKTASVQLKITSLSPTDLAGDVTTGIFGAGNPITGIVGIGTAAAGLAGSITSTISPALNIGITVDSVMVDPYRRG